MKEYKTIRNTMANLSSRLWGIVSVYLFIPLYIRYFGEEAYGLVSFFATLQATMNLLGLGLSGTLRREFATGNNDNENKSYKYKLLRGTELIYGGIAILIVIITMISSGYISNSWFNLVALNPEVVQTTLSLMGISIGIQLITNLYHGCLLGLNKQVKANIYYLLWASGKSIGSVLILALISPSLVYFYMCHIFFDVIYFVLIRVMVIKSLKNSMLKWTYRDFKMLEKIWKYSLGLLTISLISVVTRQLDKTIISKFLSLTELGAYNLSITLGQVTAIISSALSITLFTNFTKMYSLKQKKELTSYFLKYNKIVSLIIISMGSYIAIYSRELMLFWTGNYVLVESIGYGTSFVVMGTVFSSLQELPYSFVLAHSDTKINRSMGIYSLPFIIIMPFIAIRLNGIQGAAISYLTIMFLQTMAYIYLVYRKYIGNKVFSWMVKQYIIPTMIMLSIAWFSKIIISGYEWTPMKMVLYAVFVGGITLIGVLAINYREIIEKFIISKRKERIGGE